MENLGSIYFRLCFAFFLVLIPDISGFKTNNPAINYITLKIGFRAVACI